MKCLILTNCAKGFLGNNKKNVVIDNHQLCRGFRLNEDIRIVLFLRN